MKYGQSLLNSLKLFVLAGLALFLYFNMPAASNAQGTTLSQAGQEFLKTTGLTPGAYEIKKGQGQCFAGSLVVIEKDGTLTVMLGASSLLSHSPGGFSDETEHECQISTSSVAQSAYLKMQRHLKCKKNDIKYRTEIWLLDKGLRYLSQVTNEGQTSTQADCYLVPSTR